MSDLVGNLKSITQNVLNGGGPEAIKRHTSRGKLLARERIDQVRLSRPLIICYYLITSNLFDITVAGQKLSVLGTESVGRS